MSLKFFSPQNRIAAETTIEEIIHWSLQLAKKRLFLRCGKTESGWKLVAANTTVLPLRTPTVGHKTRAAETLSLKNPSISNFALDFCRVIVHCVAMAMAMDDTPGGWARVLYSGMMKSISPLLFLNLQYRRWQGGEQYWRWRERMGYPSRERPSGLLIWFHAVSVGEGISAIPVILRCREARPLITILMTTSTAAAHSVLEQRLPPEVILQFAPVDTPMAVDRFLLHWTPEAAIFMESELWPTLIFKAALKGIPLALLNARMSFKSFERWSAPPLQPLVAAMLARFSLVAPLSTKEAIRYQILGASPSVIHFAGNLKYACAVRDAQKKPGFGMVDIEAALVDRKVWLAASTHAKEENAITRIHKELKNWVPHLLTIIVPRQPSRGQIIMTHFQQQGFRVAVRSKGHQISRNIDVYVADTLGELNQFYAMVPIAFVGGSLVQGLAGHNIAEAAAAGCVVLTGYHIGHFQEMAQEMQKMSPVSVQQVDEEGLADTLRKFLTDETSLDERRAAAEGALSAAASGVITRDGCGHKLVQGLGVMDPIPNYILGGIGAHSCSSGSTHSRRHVEVVR